MTLRNSIKQKLSTFKVEDFQHMYHFLKSIKYMDSLFYATHIYVNTRDIVEH